MARTIAVLGASNTGKSTLVDRMCALEGQPHPAAGAGRAPGRDLHPPRRDLAGHRHPRLDRAPARRHRRAPRRRRRRRLRRPRPGRGAPRLPLPARRRGRRHPRHPLHQPHRRGHRPRPRHRRRAAGLRRAPHRAPPDPHPRRRRRSPAPSTSSPSAPGPTARASPRSSIEIPAGTLDREHEARGDAARAPLRVRRPPARGADRGPEPPSDEVYAICARVLRENRAIEALIGSAAHGNGIVRVMKALRHEAPAPAVLRERLQAQAGLAEPPLAVIFASAHRKHLGKTLLLRALEPLAAGRPLGGRARRPAHPGRSPRHPPPRRGARGDDRQRGQGRPPRRRPPRHGGRAARHPGLAPAAAADHAAHPRPHRRARQRQALRRARLARRGRRRARSSARTPPPAARWSASQGPLHLRLVRQRLKDVFGMEVEEVVPGAAYRETISKSQETAYRHKKQTGGAGQFADVKLVVAPGARGAGFTFSEVVKGGAVPQQLHPRRRAGRPRRHGARPARLPGRRRLRHPDRRPGATPVDSSDMAFRIAGRQGTARGAESRRPRPPAAGLPRRHPRARALHRQPRPHRLLARRPGPRLRRRPRPPRAGRSSRRSSPAACSAALANDVRAATQGVGWFDAAFDHYEELHGKAADRIVQERAKEPA